MREVSAQYHFMRTELVTTPKRQTTETLVDLHDSKESIEITNLQYGLLNTQNTIHETHKTALFLHSLNRTFNIQQFHK